MTVYDWERLQRLALNEALDCERDPDDKYARECALSYRKLAGKCFDAAEALRVTGEG